MYRLYFPSLESITTNLNTETLSLRILVKTSIIKKYKISSDTKTCKGGVIISGQILKEEVGGYKTLGCLSAKVTQKAESHFLQ